MRGPFWRRCLALLCLYLAAQPGWALTGPELALRLNQSWNSTPDRCVDNHSAYYCSGVMLKQVQASDPEPFWTHGPEAVARGAERFDYLRRDITPGPLTQMSGYLFADRFTAIGQDKDYQLQGDDGMNRPPELLVRNWNATPPGQLPIVAVYHDVRQPGGLVAALRDQRAWFQATGEWLPVLRLDSSDGQTPFGFDLREQVYIGYQVAARLNQRYQDDAAACPGGEASHYCNGVLIRGTVPGPPPSWNPKPNAIADKGVSFSYLRKDLGSRRIYYAQGFIVRELNYPAVHPLTLRCEYAGDAGTGAPDRCRPDCSLKGIHTLDDYRRHYPNNTYARDCSLGPSAQAFHLNNQVRFNQNWTATNWNELIITPWPLDIPLQLPLEAFFYNWEQPAGVAGAQYIQRDYAQVTGRFLVIVLIDLSAPAGSVFSFDPAVQALP
ncbi:hypothetical protein [Pseudomonas japonica]|uniref:Halovibrin HvnC n=1 Tax=Pseudomonas japonica TaxID=256466 RepID=A0A239ABA9_9PSED|nr:hypothetical protein [Pseudomonas japonica]SNR92829.1 hypothetical protein SAMN05444352_101334 [Pseudomonas japonica]